MTPSNCVLLSWNLTILFLLSLPTLWKFFSWGGVLGGLSIVLIVAVVVAANGDLVGDDWSRNEPRTFKMFLGDVMYVVFGALLSMIPGLIAAVIILPIVALVALLIFFDWGWIVVFSILIVGSIAYSYKVMKPLTDRQLLRIIETAAVKKEARLIICDRMLTSLPPKIGQLTELQYLNIRGNKLTSLPPQIGQLTNLYALYISGNKLTSLPPQIGQLTNLEYLDISENQLKSLPPEIGQLTNLLSLDIGRNKLSILPPEIRELTNLIEMRISHNQVTSLPVEIIQMTELDLYVNGVMLTGRYKKTHPARWRTKWLLSEGNAELRRLLIQVIGYERICQELHATELDAWREYTLLKIDDRVDVEKICLLKMTCPSTGYIYAIRVPPDLESAREAIKWVNWGIDPEEFSVQT